MKILFWVLGVLVAAILILVAMAPAIVSSSWGHQTMSKILDDRIKDGSAEFSGLKLSWFGPQKIENFTLVDASGNAIVKLGALESNISLLKLLSKGFEGAEFKIVGLDALIVQNPDTGQTNIEEALNIHCFPAAIQKSEPIQIINGNGLIKLVGNRDLEVNLQGATRYSGLPGKFDMHFTKIGDDQKWSADITNFPVALLDAVVEMQDSSLRGILGSVLGEAVDLHANETVVDNGVNFHVKASAQNFFASLDGRYDTNRIYLNSPATLKINVTQDLIQMITHSQAKEWTLPQPVMVDLNIRSFNVPAAFLFEGIQKDRIGELVFQTELDIPAFEIHNIKHKELNAKIHDLKLKLDSISESDHYSTSFVGGISMVRDVVKVDLLANFPKPHQISLIKQSFSSPQDVKLSVQDLPTVLVDTYAGTKSFLTEMLGKEISIIASTEQDRVKTDVIGTLGKVRVSSYIKDQTIYLEEPLTAQFQPSTEFGVKFLGNAIPVFNEFISAQNPISITISPENFAVSMASTIDFENIQIGNGTIEAGKMLFNNSGELKKLLKLINISDGSKEVSIWATPLYFSVNKGVLSLKRMDMLVMDRYPIAVWGKIDLPEDHVDMVIGITGQALSNALHIPQEEKDNMLQLPLKGKLSNVRIDQTKAAARIAALIAKSKPGNEGLILSTVLEIANGKSSEPAVPSPTTYPFPWGTVQADDSNHEVSPKRKRGASKDVEKATKLINKLLG